MNNNVSHNNNGAAKKSKRRFNIVDFFIILIAIMLIAVLIYSISPWSQIKKLLNNSDVKLQYVVEIRGVDKDFSNLIKDKDSVVNSVTKNSLGTVSGAPTVNASTSLSYQIDDANNIVGVLVEDSQKCDITVIISSNAEYEEGVGYTVNGCRIAVGEEIFLRFPQFSCSGYCVALNTKS